MQSSPVADSIRTTIKGTPSDGPDLPVATPFPVQDSSMMSRLAEADCLVIRPPDAPAARKGEVVEIIPLSDILGA